MKKIILFFLATGFATAIDAQEIKLENDTLYYGSHKFYEGQLLKLGYGSGENKDFAFIKIGMALTKDMKPGHFNKLKADHAKRSAKVTSIYKASAGYIVRASIVCDPCDGFNTDEYYQIMIEGAVDNKELIL